MYIILVDYSHLVFNSFIKSMEQEPQNATLGFAD